MNTWIDLVPLEWFEFKHTISAHPFCHECDIYGEKQWVLHDEYPAVLIDAPWPVFRDIGNVKPRWIWICHECFFGGEEEEDARCSCVQDHINPNCQECY